MRSLSTTIREWPARQQRHSTAINKQRNTQIQFLKVKLKKKKQIIIARKYHKETRIKKDTLGQEIHFKNRPMWSTKAMIYYTQTANKHLERKQNVKMIYSYHTASYKYFAMSRHFKFLKPERLTKTCQRLLL